MVRFFVAIGSLRYYILAMRKQINISINEQESARLDALRGGKSAYTYVLEALREKMQREEGANK